MIFRVANKNGHAFVGRKVLLRPATRDNLLGGWMWAGTMTTGNHSKGKAGTPSKWSDADDRLGAQQKSPKAEWNANKTTRSGPRALLFELLGTRNTLVWLVCDWLVVDVYWLVAQHVRRGDPLAAQPTDRQTAGRATHHHTHHAENETNWTS